MERSIYFQEMWQLALDGKLQGIWFWAAVYALAVCTYSVIFQIRTRNWPFAMGMLRSLAAVEFGTPERQKIDQDYVAEALYSYEVSGVSYRGNRVSPWIFVASHNARFVLQKQLSSVEHFPDGQVKVFFNPKRPRKSYLIVAGKFGILVSACLGVLPMLLFYLRFYV